MVTYCKKCLFPETKPDLFFDQEGVCDACHSADRKHAIENAIDWEARAKDFEKLLQTARDKKPNGYNCIVPVSGGKDSTWQVYAMKEIHKMRPLAVTFDQFDQTPEGLKCLEVLRSIGVDHVHFTLNPKIVKSLVLKAFELLGDHYWVNHVGIFTVPYHFAVMFDIPLVMFGENPQLEYGGPEKSRDNMVMDRAWRQEFGLMRNFREEDMLDDEISKDDLTMLYYPPDDVIENKGILGTFYGHFFKWNARDHLEVVSKFGWKGFDVPRAGSYLNYENIDMHFIEIRERQKYLKYGYARVTDQLNIDIRNGVISREEALSHIHKDGQVDEHVIEEFCEYLDISRQKYNEIMDTFVNHEIFVKDNHGMWILRNERS
tara:strand:+ start:767 stop:1888 length:1122 start_codon:yes stop_codon:yes gene_type:complete